MKWLLVALVISAPLELAAHASCDQAVAKVRKQFESEYQGDHASALITRDDEVLLEEGVGGATSSSRFLLASVTKPITAMLILRQIEHGKMSLEDFIAEDLPQALIAKIGADWKKIRIRHLLEHGSGIQDYINAHPGSSFLSQPHSYEEILGTISVKLGFNPGSQLDYCNTGYLILAQILAARTGKSYAAWVKSLATTLGWQDTGLMNQATPGIYGETGIHPADMEGVGNGYSSTRDQQRLLRALDDDTLLSPAMITRMLTPDPECKGGNKCDKYGLAFTLHWNEIEGRDWYLKTGHLSGVANVIAKVPSSHLNLTILSDDHSSKDTEAVAKTALQTLVAGGCGL